MPILKEVAKITPTSKPISSLTPTSTPIPPTETPIPEPYVLKNGQIFIWDKSQQLYIFLKISNKSTEKVQPTHLQRLSENMIAALDSNNYLLFVVDLPTKSIMNVDNGLVYISNKWMEWDKVTNQLVNIIYKIMNGYPAVWANGMWQEDKIIGTIPKKLRITSIEELAALDAKGSPVGKMFLGLDEQERIMLVKPANEDTWLIAPFGAALTEGRWRVWHMKDKYSMVELNITDSQSAMGNYNRLSPIAKMVIDNYKILSV